MTSNEKNEQNIEKMANDAVEQAVIALCDVLVAHIDELTAKKDDWSGKK